MSIAAVHPFPIARSTPQPLSTPFCDQRFQWIRVAASVVCARIMALFYRIISISYMFLNGHKARSYQLIANAYTGNANKKWDIYSSHLKQNIIDFSVNSVRHINKPFSGAETEWDKLKEMYGSEQIERLAEIGTPDMPIYKSLLSRLKPNSGCCLGVTLAFLSQVRQHYHQQLSLRKSPLDSMESAVKSVAPLFANEVPLHAQPAQIFQDGFALHAPLSYVHAMETFHRQENQARLNSWTQLGLLNQSTQNYLQLAAALRSIVSELEASPALVNERDRKSILRDQMLAQAYGLQLASPVISPNTDQGNTELARFMITLSEGMYKVTIKFTDQPNTHAISFIKTSSGNCFVQEPNYGTFAFSLEESTAWFFNAYSNVANCQFYLCS